jgi:uncharacterized membrane protein YkvA (DUF1232 family)
MSRVRVHAKKKAREIKQNLYVLYLAYRDPRVPRHAKLFALCVVAYAFSPIDLIPDFVPVLGYLDDVILVPLGVLLALKMIPPSVVADCKERAEELREKGKPKVWAAGILVVLVWIALALWAATALCRVGARWIR